MNLFFLDIDPKKCAEYHCDKHVVKMILEIVQMLYTSHHILGPKEKLPEDCYKPVSVKHPTAIWIRTSEKNYLYAIEVAMSLAKEYTYRYLKTHSCEKHVVWLSNNLPQFGAVQEYSNKVTLSTNKYFQNVGITQVPLAMPEECIVNDTIQSYR